MNATVDQKTSFRRGPSRIGRAERRDFGHDPADHESKRERRRTDDALLGRFANGRDPRVREQLVARFMPLARSLAMRYKGGREPLEDLIQVASVGLVKAIDGFDPARGKPFTAYAVPTILGELRRHFRDHVWNVHLPRSLQELTIAVENATAKLTEELGRSPTPEQIAARLEISQEEVLDALAADEARHTLSLDAPRARDADEATPTVETVGGIEPGYDRVEAQLASRSAELEDREWRVLELRFAAGMNQYEIGRELGVSQMQVSRIMRRALRKLAVAVRGGEEIDEASIRKRPG